MANHIVLFIQERKNLSNSSPLDIHMNMKVNFSIITIVAILFGTSMTTTTNTIWATSPQVKIDSQSCHGSGGFRVNDIDFSWSGFEPNVQLSVDILDGYHNVVATKNLQGTSDGSGSGEISKSLYINAVQTCPLWFSFRC